MYAHRRRRRFLFAVLKQVVPYGSGLLDVRIVVNGCQLTLKLDPWSGDRPSFFEVMDEMPAEALQQAPTPELILDAGANIGLFSLRARAYYSKVPILAFEPLPRNCERLAYHNAVNQARIIVHQAAVWTAARQTYLNYHATNTGQLAFLSTTTDQAQPFQILVNCVRLPDIVPEIGTKRLLLKMDIEGAELPVLEDLLPLITKPSVLLCELHDDLRSRPHFIRLLEHHGWKMRTTKNEADCSYWYCTLNKPVL